MTLSPQNERLATVFGGSGFVGRYIVRTFAQAGWRVRVAVRRPDLAGFLVPYGTVGQVLPIQANLRYPASVEAAVRGAGVVVNACGIQSERGKQTFEAVHVFGAETIARAAKAAGAESLIHISGLGAQALSRNAYIASKGKGEDAARAAFAEAVILRPSVIFGAEDAFFNRFADLARFFPILPAFAGGQTKLQPVYVADIAAVARKGLAGELKPSTVYELGGPQIITLIEAIKLALRVSERERFILPLGLGMSRLFAGGTEWASALTLGLFPKILTTTRDQIELLAQDNIVSEQAIAEKRDFAGLNILPRAAETILPAYLTRYRKTGQFAENPFS